MAGTITTNNPNGLTPQTGFFSAPVGTPINQSFFDAAFAGRINGNKIYKETYNCDIIGTCTMSTWLDEFMGYDTDCFPAYTLLERYSLRQQVKAKLTVTIPAYPATGLFTLSAQDHFVNGNYVLPQVGNSLVLAPNGNLADIITVTHATANDTVLTIRLRPSVVGTNVVNAGDTAYVLSGSTIEDCACPTGQFAVEDLPLEQDVKMIHFGDKGSLCGDAIYKCQYLKIPFTDDRGNVINEAWWNEPLQDMYRRFEDRKHMETLFNDSFGIIPTLKARGIKFTPASTTEITTDDVRDWKQALNLAGIACMEYAVFAGREIFSQFQRMLLTAGVTQLLYEEKPMNDCAWINMEYCGIKVEGMTLHIYDECSFGNGHSLGAAGMVFPKSAIFVPMCNNPSPVKRTSITTTGLGYDVKMFTRVYFQEQGNGRVWDALIDSNGYLNGASGRNTFGTGCKTHEWSIETRFLNEIHCPNSWGYIGL